MIATTDEPARTRERADEIPPDRTRTMSTDIDTDDDTSDPETIGEAKDAVAGLEARIETLETLGTLGGAADEYIAGLREKTRQSLGPDRGEQRPGAPEERGRPCSLNEGW